MSRIRLVTTMAAIIVAASASTATAQYGGGGRNSGLSGFGGGGSGFGRGGMSSGMGMSGFGSSGFGGFGSSGFGGMGGMGMGGFGSSGFGSSGFSGMGGFGSGGFGSGMSSGAFGGMSLSNNGGTGAAQGGQAFVGRDSGDMQSVFSQLGRNSNRFFQQMNRQMAGGGGQRANRRNLGQQENQQLPVRVQLNVAFDRPRAQPAVLATTVSRRLNGVLAKRGVESPQVEVFGDTVVLRGTVESDSQRMVIERLVSMEPGVGAVESQLTVALPLDPALPLLPPQENN